MVQENIAWFPQYVDSQAAVGTGNPAYASGTTYFTTTPGGQVISERVPNGSGGYNAYYYLYDGLGSVVALTNSTGAVVNSYAYDPYGNATSVSETVANPFRFIGAIWDSSTGLYKMGERYYDPTIGRFTQLDPLGGGYIYEGDNPVNFVDPSGLAAIPEIDPLRTGGRASAENVEDTVKRGRRGGQGSGIPAKAYATYDYIKAHNWSPPRGYSGSEEFENRGGVLPRGGVYREYDIEPGRYGRGGKRIVVDIRTGHAWYTNQHYRRGSFRRFR